MQRNNPTDAQQPAPAFANDPTGFWGGILKANEAHGLQRVLPDNTMIQSDVMAKARLLQGQLNWSPVLIAWEGLEFVASIADNQLSLLLQSGGTTNQGTITLTINKLLFETNFPSQQDRLQLKAGGQWLTFAVIDVDGENDDNNPALTITCEKEDTYES